MERGRADIVDGGLESGGDAVAAIVGLDNVAKFATGRGEGGVHGDLTSVLIYSPQKVSKIFKIGSFF